MKKIMILMSMAIMFLICSASAATTKNKSDETAAHSANDVRIGYVDMNIVLNECNEGKLAKAKLQAEGKTLKQKLDKMQSDLNKMKEELDKQKLVLSPKAAKEKESIYQQKLVEFQKTGSDYEKMFAEKEANFIKPITDKMQLVIRKVGESEGYTIIVGKDTVLYSPTGTNLIDLTDKVKREYNFFK